MAIVVEDGTGLPNANSYASVAYADAYFGTRGVTAWTGADSVKEFALIAATDYIETRFSSSFKGCKLTETQALSFPRDDSGVLPVALQKATCEYALRALGGTALMPDPVTDESGNRVKSKSEKLGPLEEKTEYMESTGAAISKPYPSADLLLKSLLRTGGGTYR